MQFRIQSLLTIFVFFIFVPLAQAVEVNQASQVIKTDRYTTVKVGPNSYQQRDPLKTVIEIKYPSVIKTIRQAVTHTLDRSGYKLASGNANDPKMAILMKLPLPEVQRSLGPLTVEQALEVLAGPAFKLVTDPVHRLVSFELLPEFQ